MKRIVVNRCSMCSGLGRDVLGSRCNGCGGAGNFTVSHGASRTTVRRVERALRRSRTLPRLRRYRTGGEGGIFDQVA